MPFFKTPCTSRGFVEVLLCVLLRDCALFVSFLPQIWQCWGQECSKNEREKGQQNHPVAVKGFQRSYVRNARAGAFHRGKMPSFARVVLAPGPAETGEPGAQSGAYPCESSSSVDAKVPQSPTQGRRKKPKPTAIRTPLNPYPPNLTAPTTFLLFPTLSNVPFRLKHPILKSI